MQPLVSVIVPVWNVAEYVRECLDSLLHQTLPADQLEVIAVDDGSTDDSGVILDRYAAAHARIRVVHQPNSGGPGRPRNTGLDLANGRYVFFLDADDYLGPEALARLTERAERNGSDVVLARMVGVDGRPVPQAAFRRNRDRASIAQVYSSLSVLKLFRRSLIEGANLRFVEGLHGGEDAPFTIGAYLAAEAISVEAEYPCYYARFRVGSQSASGWKWGPELVGHLRRMGERMELVGDAMPRGDDRNAMMARHLADLIRPFKPQWRRLPDELRHEAFGTAAQYVQRWCSEEDLRRLPAWNAVRGWCLLHGLEQELVDIAEIRPDEAGRRAIADGGRVYLGYTHFRDRAGIPDWCFDVTDRLDPVVTGLEVSSAASRLHIAGVGYLPIFGGRVSVLLRNADGREVELPTEAGATPQLRDRRAEYPEARFTLDIDPGAVARAHTLGSSPWQLSLRFRSKVVSRDRELPATNAVLAADGVLQRTEADTLQWQRPRWWRRVTTGRSTRQAG